MVELSPELQARVDNVKSGDKSIVKRIDTIKSVIDNPTRIYSTEDQPPYLEKVPL
jgi:hypothetical protein